ncbi:N-alpha-acetyltransferase 38, NatC auxiliary subunit [Dermacentor andersoni]|uniref:N-alpha-acetyltransferase 38, NatC auxiliary subunit n=1 Tax=Dermacentor andersoni TaxID=34620 RepID=UPI002155F68F|nr:N-alpha-acetyltransferase 38, NatC auxiliary subunit-like [Dermacentor andersoni]
MAAGEERRARLRRWLNQSLRVEMSDGRTLVGSFLCTDRDQNIILGSCSEYLQPDSSSSTVEPRILGLAMVPGQHIISVHVDEQCSG